MAIHLKPKSLEISTGNVFAVLNEIMQSPKTGSIEWGPSEENSGHSADQGVLCHFYETRRSIIAFQRSSQ